MGKKVLIVGGVAGGASAAARLRRLDEQAQIIMFEKDAYISFANCGLPYYIGDVITERGKLLVQTPEAMKERFNIDVRVFSKVVGVKPDTKTVVVESRDRGTYEESYDCLVLAPGSQPIVPNIPNSAPDRVFSVRNVDDTDSIKNYLNDHKPTSAVVVGGGFIGIEMAENLRHIGLDVTLVEAAPHILAPLDSEMVALAEAEMRKNGVSLLLGEMLTAIEQAGSRVKLSLSSGKSIETDMVISAIGVRPATDFLKDSGIELGPRGHIVVDDHMRTNKPGVYAVGDAIQVMHFVTKQPTAIPLAGPANKQGRIVADNIAGIDRSYGGSLGTSVVKVFNLTVASVGINERTAKQLGLEYTPIYTHPFSHATYYPGAKQMAAKLLFNKHGDILGCQMVGPDGVDKRLDVVATTMRLGGKVTDLCELELAYAPPFSSAKDPVNMLGYVAQNILEGSSEVADYSVLNSIDPETTILLDTRTVAEHQQGAIPGSVNIPVDELRQRLDELDPKKEIVEYCRVGLRGHVAERILAQNGFKVKNLTGGWLTYEATQK